MLTYTTMQRAHAKRILDAVPDIQEVQASDGNYARRTFRIDNLTEEQLQTLESLKLRSLKNDISVMRIMRGEGADDRPIGPLCASAAHTIRAWFAARPKWVFEVGPHASPWCVWQVTYRPATRATTDTRAVPAHIDVKFCRTSPMEVNVASVVVQVWNIPDGQTVPQLLAEHGYMRYTDELREEYDMLLRKHAALERSVGRECYVTHGVGVDDSDDLLAKRSYGDRRNVNYSAAVSQQDKRVVVDVYWEDEDRDNREVRRRSRGRDSVAAFWEEPPAPEPDGDEVEAEDEVEDAEVAADADVPVDAGNCCDTHKLPLDLRLVVFDLLRHARVSVHVTQLRPWKYDPVAADNLVLPPAMRSAIHAITEFGTSGRQFADVAANKGGSLVILCQGGPGLGKSLTAELVAEGRGRPLYRVQCAQLGLDPDTLESRLRVVLARMHRWNALCLLDEADVYVHRRDTDLVQNAIVGVFLRLLEYSNGLLFLTTNRGDTVDDAVLSRCTLRLRYEMPTPDDRAEIWHRLARVNGLSDIVDPCLQDLKQMELSGRDIKNLLRLVMVFNVDLREDTIKKVEWLRGMLA